MIGQIWCGIANGGRASDERWAIFNAVNERIMNEYRLRAMGAIKNGQDARAKCKAQLAELMNRGSK